MATFASRFALLTSLCLGLLAQISCDDTAVAPIPDGSAGASGESGEGDGGAGGNAEVPERLLGRPCDTDADCGADGLECFAADRQFAVGTGSAAGGVCTIACQDDSTCQRWGPGASCIAVSEVPADPGYCFQGCVLGEVQRGSAKCHGRSDFACQPLDAGKPEEHKCPRHPCDPGETCIDERCSVINCLPRCTSDAQCAEGRFCDVILGTCMSEAPPPSDLGEDCSVKAAERQCIGTCAALLVGNVSVVNFCTEPCVLGYPCGNGRGACLMLDHDFDATIGDIGYCMEACDCDDDCTTSGFVCDPAGGGFGRAGLCGHPFAEDGSAIETLACGAEG